VNTKYLTSEVEINISESDSEYTNTIRVRALAPTKMVEGESDEQMEFDLRLTYRRSKQLYPFSNISYQDYEKLQMQMALRRPVGSGKNKRMVK
jgi:hypothetical protein